MLIDTNVWSELSRPHPHPKVADWVRTNFKSCVLSTLVQAEILYGIEAAPDEARRAELQTFHDDLLFRIEGRLLPFDTSAAIAWSEMKDRLKRTGRLIADLDMMIAAQAIGAELPLVTRNVSDMARTSAVIIDPWQD